MPSPPMATSFPLRKVGKLLLAALLLAFLFWKNADELPLLVSIFSLESLPGALAGMSFLALSQVLVAWRQYQMLAFIGHPVGYRNLLHIIYASFFANNFLPGGAGYDLFRVYGTRKYTSLGYSSLTGLVLVDRVLGLCGLTVLAGLAAGLAIAQGKMSVTLAGLPWVLAVLGSPALVVAALLTLRYDSLYGFCQRLAARTPFRQQAANALEVLRQYSLRRRFLLRMIGLSLAVQTSAVLGVMCLSSLLFDADTVYLVLVLTPLVFLISSIPVTPGNMGWTEMMAGVIWDFFSLHGGVALFLQWRLVGLVFSAGGLYSYLMLKKL